MGSTSIGHPGYRRAFHQSSMLFRVVLLATLIGVSLQQACDPTTCVLPDCRCFDDPKPPGDLPINEIPQIIMVSGEGTINFENVEYYREILQVSNPNGCPARGTFFIMDQGSDYLLIQSLFSDGNEIGINSQDGTAPASSTDWINLFKNVQSKLQNDGGIDAKSVLGARVPQLAIGGSDEFIGIGAQGMLYDSSCTSVSMSSKDSFIWPYTYNSVPGPNCDSGVVPDLAFNGKWEAPIADLHDLTPDALPCVVPSACANVTTKKDAFDLFFTAFTDHYTGGRTPMHVIVDPAWAKNTDFREGTTEFLQYVRAAYGDNVWIVPIVKALQWIQTPVPIANLTDFAPWSC